ncbi:MAG: Uma2 family endonuclease [Oscillatoria sp. SIO1A7]|nr:Uma2 family endonuclease [Oscillatoria sp. SIO1A7]
MTPAASKTHLLLENVTWADYQTLLKGFGDRPQLRSCYLEGTLEIMAASPEHEAIKKNIARLIELYALEKDIRLFSCGSTTVRREAKSRGVEPDESYCIDSRKAIPDLAIEVLITNDGIDKLEIYKGLNVREVWVWKNKGFSLYRMRVFTEGYEVIRRSTLFPDLDPNTLAKYVNPEREPQMLQAFRQEICREAADNLE